MPELSDFLLVWGKSHSKIVANCLAGIVFISNDPKSLRLRNCKLSGFGKILDLFSGDKESEDNELRGGKFGGLEYLEGVNASANVVKFEVSDDFLSLNLKSTFSSLMSAYTLKKRGSH